MVHSNKGSLANELCEKNRKSTAEEGKSAVRSTQEG